MPRRIHDTPKARAALARYRIMAWLTGTFLLLLTLEMVLRYLINVHGDYSSVLGIWIAITHGWIYVLYLLSVADLWSRMRWRLMELVMMVLAGVIPVMSFIVEAKLHDRALTELEAVANATR